MHRDVDTPLTKNAIVAGALRVAGLLVGILGAVLISAGLTPDALFTAAIIGVLVLALTAAALVVDLRDAEP